MLLVQGTGVGKSAVPQTVGTVTCGVTLVIENTLSLSADQHSKIKNANPGHGPIKAFHLDSIRTKRNQDKLCKLLVNLPDNTDATIFLFSSPEYLLNDPWKDTMKCLINKNILRLVCIDEVHQFVMFGCTFRPDFGLLKQSLFQHMISQKQNELGVKLNVPLLLMTATFNIELLNILQRMIGIRVPPTMFLWSGRDCMQRRTVRISVSMTVQYLKQIKDILKKLLSDNLSKKAIIYTNTASKAEVIKQEIDSWLNLTSSFEGDTIMITGEMESEVKLISATTFTTEQSDPRSIIDNNEFYPRILIATSSCIGAGLDSSSVFSVIRVGFPTSILDMIQEMGRCGRNRNNDGTNPSDDFILFLSLQDFVYLNERLYDDSDSDDGSGSSRVIDYESQIQLQERNLLKVASFVYLKSTCWHSTLEEESGSPLEPPVANRPHCMKSCPACLDSINDYIMPVNRLGLSRFLAHTFINTSAVDLSPMNLVKLLHDFPNVGQQIYSRPRSTAAPENRYLQSTILQLIASGMIKLQICKISKTAKCCLSIRELDSSPTYLDSTYWKDFYLL